MSQCKQRPLTERQVEIVQFIARYTAAHRHAPSTRDFMLEFGWTSTNASWDHLKLIKAKGYIDWTPRLARTVYLRAPATALLKRRERTARARP